MSKTIRKMNPPKLSGTSKKSTVTLQNFGTEEFRPSDFTVVKKLGEGAFGTVQLVVHQKMGQLALKAIDVTQSDVETVQQEVDFMRSVSNKYIVAYYGSFLTKDFCYVAMEYCPHGCLRAILDVVGTLPDAAVAVVARCCCEGLKCLHASNKIHRDIKASNILIANDGTAKLSDFGVSAGDGRVRHTVIGSPYWMAPEVITAATKGGYDCKADVWSLGVTCVELAEGAPPLARVPPMKALFLITQPPARSLSHPEAHSAEFVSFLSHCLAFEPQKRSSVSELLSLPFVAEANDTGMLLKFAEEAEKKTAEKKEKGLEYDEEDEEALIEQLTPSQQQRLNAVKAAVSSLSDEVKELEQQKQKQDEWIEREIAEKEKQLKELREEIAQKSSCGDPLRAGLEELTAHVLDPTLRECDVKRARERARKQTLNTSQPQKELIDLYAECEVARKLYLSSLLLLVKLEDRDAGELYPESHYLELEKSCADVELDDLPIELIKKHNATKGQYMKPSVSKSQKSSECTVM